MKNNAIITIALGLKEKAPFPHPLVHSTKALGSLALSVAHFAVHSANPFALLVRSSKFWAIFLRKYFTSLIKKVVKKYNIN